MRGTLAASRLLLGGGRSLAARARGRFGPLWDGSLPLALTSRLPGSGDAGSHFSAALIPGPLMGRGSVEPDPPLTRDGRRTPSRAAHPRAPLTFLISRAASPPRRLAFSACSFGVVRGSGN